MSSSMIWTITLTNDAAARADGVPFSPSSRSCISNVLLPSRNSPPPIRIRSRPEIGWPSSVKSGAVSLTIQASENSRRIRVQHRAEQAEPPGPALLRRGSLPDRIEMKMMLSTPSTISRNVSVRNAIQVSRVSKRRHRTSQMLAVGRRRSINCTGGEYDLRRWRRGLDRAHTPKSSGSHVRPSSRGRRHEPEQRRRGDDRGAREVAFAAESHAVLPVPVERRDRALPRTERIRPLSEARSAPGLADLFHRPSGRRSQSIRPRDADRRTSICRPTPPDPGKMASARSTLPIPCAARRTQHERGLQQVVVAAVRARADHRLVERDPLACDLLRRDTRSRD